MAAIDASAPQPSSEPEQKPYNTLILDSGPIIKNNPSVSTLLAKCETIITIPEVVDEIRDAATRERFNTILKPFLKLRSPRPDSVKFIIDFARRTGDLAVLSKTDIRILALAYELEVELNNGDWRLKRVPGQKELNGPFPEKLKTEQTEKEENGGVSLTAPQADTAIQQSQESKPTETMQDLSTVTEALEDTKLSGITTDSRPHGTDLGGEVPQTSDSQDVTTQTESTDGAQAEQEQNQQEEEDDEADDSEGWITPSNIKKHQQADAEASGLVDTTPSHIPVATLTTDFAMQNVLLQVNLNLISESLLRIKKVKTTALRCYACFLVLRDMSKQFCPRCGKPSLTRVSASTDSKGGFKVHLKKGFKLNTRGDRFSIPKPGTASASGRVKAGGGTGGWGNELILAEDQKEYVKAIGKQQRTRERDLMNEDFLPSILSGERNSSQGKIRVGGGRNINSTKRKK